MKLTFRMTADDYVVGWKYKTKKTKSNNALAFFVSAILIVAVIVLTMLKILDGGFFLIIVVLLFPIFNKLLGNKLRRTEFNESAVLNGENTIKIYEGGIEIISSFEKLFAPWNSVFAVKETKENLIILPTYTNGVYVINKQKNESVELVELINKLKQNVKMYDKKEAK